MAPAILEVVVLVVALPFVALPPSTLGGGPQIQTQDWRQSETGQPRPDDDGIRFPDSHGLEDEHERPQQYDDRVSEDSEQSVPTVQPQVSSPLVRACVGSYPSDATGLSAGGSAVPSAASPTGSSVVPSSPSASWLGMR